MMKSEQEKNILLCEAAEAAIHWAQTGLNYFTMRDKVEAYFQASTPDNKTDTWYVQNARKLAMNSLMTKCITPLTRNQYERLDCEVMDIAATLPEKAVRHMRR